MKDDAFPVEHHRFLSHQSDCARFGRDGRDERIEESRQQGSEPAWRRNKKGRRGECLDEMRQMVWDYSLWFLEVVGFSLLVLVGLLICVAFLAAHGPQGVGGGAAAPRSQRRRSIRALPVVPRTF